MWRRASSVIVRDRLDRYCSEVLCAGSTTGGSKLVKDFCPEWRLEIGCRLLSGGCSETRALSLFGFVFSVGSWPCDW